MLTQPSALQNGLCNNTGHMFGHLIGHLMNDPLDDLSDQHDGILEAPKVNDLEKQAGAELCQAQVKLRLAKLAS